MQVITAYLTRTVMQSGGGSSSKEYVDDLRDVFLNGGSWLEASKKRVISIGNSPSPYYEYQGRYTNVFNSYDSVTVTSTSVSQGTSYLISNGIWPQACGIIIDNNGHYVSSAGLWDACLYKDTYSISSGDYQIYKYKTYSGSPKTQFACRAYDQYHPDTPTSANVTLYQSSVPPYYTKVPFLSSYPIFSSVEFANWFISRMRELLSDPSSVTSRDLDDLEDYLEDHCVEPGE